MVDLCINVINVFIFFEHVFVFLVHVVDPELCVWRDESWEFYKFNSQAISFWCLRCHLLYDDQMETGQPPFRVRVWHSSWFAGVVCTMFGQNFNLETMFGVNYMLKPTTSILRVACFRLQGESVLHTDASRGTSDHTQGWHVGVPLVVHQERMEACDEKIRVWAKINIWLIYG